MQANFHFSAGPRKNGVVLGGGVGLRWWWGGYGETPLNSIKPTEVGLTVAAKRMTSTQPGDVGEDGITTARRERQETAQFSPGGGGPGDESCMYGRKYKKKKTGLENVIIR